MSLDFITADPATDAFQKGTEFQDSQRKVREARGVDAAIRAGASDMMNNPQQRGSGSLGGITSNGGPPPSAAPQQAPQPAPTQAAPAPAAPAPPDPTSYTPAPSSSPPPSPSASGVMASLPLMGPVGQTAPPGIPPGRSGFASSVARTESSGQPISVVNSLGYSGKYQVGKAALQAAGAYVPAQGENMKDNQNWSGTINLPGQAPMTRAQFLQSETAQDQAFQLHTANLDRETQTRGLTQYIGQTVGGVPITQDSIRAMMQVGGPTGAQKFIESGGAYNPADANGTTIAAYANQVLNGGARTGGNLKGPAPAISPTDAAAAGQAVSLGLAGGTQSAQGTQSMPSGFDAFNARTNPILSQLADTPGGGATILSLLGQQTRTYGQDLNRQTSYQRLAMQALGRGDKDVFQYYAQLGGINVPAAVMENAGMQKRLATVSLLAERFYRDDPAAAQRLTAAYLQSGDIQQAFQTAGPPANNPHLSVQWLRQGEQEYMQTFNPRTGQVAPAMDPGGQPVVRDVRPTAAASTVRWVTQADGTQQAFQSHPDGTMTAVTGPDNKQMVQAAKPLAGGRVADRTVRLGMLKAAGFDDQTANAIAAGVNPTPNAIANAYSRTQTSLTRDAALTGDTPDKVQAKTEATMDAMFGPQWRTSLQGRGAGQPPPAAPSIGPQAAPQPPAPALPMATQEPPMPPSNDAGPIVPPQSAPTPTPPAPQATPVRPPNVPRGSVFSPSRQQYRDPAGNLFDAQGNPVPAAAP